MLYSQHFTTCAQTFGKWFAFGLKTENGTDKVFFPSAILRFARLQKEEKAMKKQPLKGSIVTNLTRIITSLCLPNP